MNYLTITLAPVGNHQYIIKLPKVFANHIQSWVQNYMETVGMPTLNVLLDKIQTLPINLIPYHHRDSDNPMDYVTYRKQQVQQVDIGLKSFGDFQFSLN